MDLSSIFSTSRKREYSYNSKVVTRASLNLSQVVFDPWIHYVHLLWCMNYVNVQNRKREEMSLVNIFVFIARSSKLAKTKR